MTMTMERPSATDYTYMYFRLGAPAFPLDVPQDVPAWRLNSFAISCSKFPLPHLADQQQIWVSGHKKGLPPVGPPNLVNPHLYSDSSGACQPDRAKESTELKSSPDLDDFLDDDSDPSGFLQGGGGGGDGVDADGRITKVMLCNIPCGVDRTDILQALKRCGFADKVDFIHHRRFSKAAVRRYRHHFIHTGATPSRSYSFINFVTADDAEHFADTFEDFQFPGLRSTKKCTVRLAEVGAETNLGERSRICLSSCEL
jgi:hypothetical protein